MKGVEKTTQTFERMTKKREQAIEILEKGIWGIKTVGTEVSNPTNAILIRF